MDVTYNGTASVAHNTATNPNRAQQRWAKSCPNAASARSCIVCLSDAAFCSDITTNKHAEQTALYLSRENGDKVDGDADCKGHRNPNPLPHGLEREEDVFFVLKIAIAPKNDVNHTYTTVFCCTKQAKTPFTSNK